VVNGHYAEELTTRRTGLLITNGNQIWCWQLQFIVKQRPSSWQPHILKS